MGGGLTIVYKEDLNITKHEAPKYQTMELAEFKIKQCTSLSAESLTIIYRPPDSNVRDFNIHINRADKMDAINSLDFLDSFALINSGLPNTQACKHT